MHHGTFNNKTIFKHAVYGLRYQNRKTLYFFNLIRFALMFINFFYQVSVTTTESLTCHLWFTISKIGKYYFCLCSCFFLYQRSVAFSNWTIFTMPPMAYAIKNRNWNITFLCSFFLLYLCLLMISFSCINLELLLITSYL